MLGHVQLHRLLDEPLLCGWRYTAKARLYAKSVEEFREGKTTVVGDPRG